jgi:hypothetical protein
MVEMLKKCLITTFATAGVLILSASARADVMATLISGPNKSDSSYTGVHPNVVGGAGLGNGAGLTYPVGTFTTYTVQGANASSLANAVTNNDYVTWGLSFADAWDLDGFSLRFDRNSSGPPNIEVQISVNGGAFTPVLTESFGTAGEEHINVPLTAFDNVTSVTFRAYLWGASSGGGQMDFENSANIGNGTFQLFATAVPEPASIGLLGLAGLALLRRRR